MRLSMLFPDSIRDAAAHGMIVLEVGLGGWIASGYRKDLSSLLATGLGSLFVGYALWRVRMGIPSPCHCLGPLAKLGPIQSLELATTFFLVSLLVYSSTGWTLTTPRLVQRNP